MPALAGSIRAGWSLAAAVSLLACDGPTYRIEMRPDGEAYERTFSTPTPPTGRAGKRLESYYGPPVQKEEQERWVYTGSLRGATPAELGGQGILVQLASPLGTVTTYQERLGRDDRLSARLDRVTDEIERLRGDIEAWVRVGAGEMQHRRRLQEFVDRELLPDLLELALTARFRVTDDGETRANVRATQLLVERGYGDLEELTLRVERIGQPGIAVRCRGGRTCEFLFSDVVPARALAVSMLVQRWRRSGRPADIPHLPATCSAVRGSLGSVLPELPSFQAWAPIRAPGLDVSRLADLTEEQLTEVVDVWAVESYPVFGWLVTTLACASPILPPVRGQASELGLSLYTPHEPFETTGFWDAEHGRVEWAGSLDAPGVLAFAQWSEPDRSAQRRHLGAAELIGRALGDHVTTFSTLEPEDQRAWTDFVETLEPSAELADQIRAFRLPSEPGDAPARRTDALLKPLLDALKGTKPVADARSADSTDPAP